MQARKRGSGLVVAFLAALLLSGNGGFATPAQATSSRTLEATYTTVANGWVKVERWKDNSSNFAAENYPPDGRGDQTGQRLTFFGGVARPHSSRFLLYYAPGWDTNPIPIRCCLFTDSIL